MDKIDNLRQQIDILDDSIMKLLNTRFDVTTEIGKIKSINNINIINQNREDFILNKSSKYSHFPSIIKVYNTIFIESKKLQKKD
ncbi:hypothetical protein CI105_01465 [Candidatus Izimaplasma bacterium ZiA1]|uniref:chorismate mutase n=1 Tax=Candidatus Izimoplasma sp. ZiA1 TaxID=2024899 RepID=UPI000BAA7C99|nr:hypothetical protein CI105_01465 [Candidatus Izimaplasma bacterium ZiA1]